jgi:hypothetical protein
MSEYLVVIELEGDSWGAYCPDLPASASSVTRRTKWSGSSAKRSASISTGYGKRASRFRSRPQSEQRASVHVA